MKFFKIKINNSRALNGQNFWDLTCIQGASFGLPGFFLTMNLTKKIGPSSAFFSLVISNIIIWIISLAIIDMMYRARKEHADSISENEKPRFFYKFNSAIENIKEYMGALPYYIAAWIVIIAFIIWNAIEIKENVEAISFFGRFDSLAKLRIGVAFGIITSLSAMGGIYIIRIVSIFLFPLFLLMISVLIFIVSPGVSFNGPFNVSLEAISSLVAIELPGIINLPTFFRHSKSLHDSFISLKLISIYLTIYGLFGICLGASSDNLLSQILIQKPFLVYGSILVISLSLFIITLTNIYYASAAWDAIGSVSHKMLRLLRILKTKLLFFRKGVTRSKKKKEKNSSELKKFTIIGLFSTITYLYYQETHPLILIEDLMSTYLAILCTIMFMSFLVFRSLKHTLKFQEEYISSSSWCAGCIVSTILIASRATFHIQAQLTGIISSIFTYLVLLFILSKYMIQKRDRL